MTKLPQQPLTQRQRFTIHQRFIIWECGPTKWYSLMPFEQRTAQSLVNRGFLERDGHRHVRLTKKGYRWRRQEEERIYAIHGKPNCHKLNP